MSVGDFDALLTMAFPTASESYSNPLYSQHGMTLRDCFAGKALAGILASGAGEDDDQLLRVVIATDAYGYADAMLEARKVQS